MLSCLSFKSKISFLGVCWWIKSFKLLDDVSILESNLDTFKDIGKVCLKVVLLFIIVNSIDSVRLGNWSKWLINDVFTVKYITNSEFTSWHAATDPKRKWFSASMPQLHYTLLFTNTYGWLGILMGISLLMLHMMCLSLGQLANMISFPPSSTVGVISVLLE